ncbi:hypothetical protein PLICRDRAFT_500110 [Plicaturopsis crispa FD-325 SS-3]|nr:hypothetical protein PLICRDRAFT_500110 [Plicaturopsis crispa FD-325 SS-3]
MIALYSIESYYFLGIVASSGFNMKARSPVRRDPTVIYVQMCVVHTDIVTDEGCASIQLWDVIATFSYRQRTQTHSQWPIGVSSSTTCSLVHHTLPVGRTRRPGKEATRRLLTSREGSPQLTEDNTTIADRGLRESQARVPSLVSADHHGDARSSQAERSRDEAWSLAFRSQVTCERLGQKGRDGDVS